MNRQLKIAKLDAARRQLETAIRLYFAEGDPVSIHTLTAAAHQILADLSKREGGSPTITDTLLSFVGSKKRAEARRHIARAENFFKHADRDSRGVLTFDPGLTELLLLQACTRYRELSGELVPVLAVYQGWMFVGPWAALVDVTPDRTIEGFRSMYKGATRQSFFAQALPFVSGFAAQKR